MWLIVPINLAQRKLSTSTYFSLPPHWKASLYKPYVFTCACHSFSAIHCGERQRIAIHNCWLHLWLIANDSVSRFFFNGDGFIMTILYQYKPINSNSLSILASLCKYWVTMCHSVSSWLNFFIVFCNFGKILLIISLELGYNCTYTTFTPQIKGYIHCIYHTLHWFWNVKKTWLNRLQVVPVHCKAWNEWRNQPPVPE